MLGYSQAAENNKGPIMEVLGKHLKKGASVLEIGSGSGQHAIHMSAAYPTINWIPSERKNVIPILRENLTLHGSSNIQSPLTLDLADANWRGASVDIVYAANVMHIVSIDLGERLLRLAADALDTFGALMLYGPYKYDGRFTTESNAAFDQWLKERDPASGIRDIERVTALASKIGLSLTADYSMPANNQMLVFEPSRD